MTHSAEPVRLRGMTWNHSRGYTPMVATAQRFCELHYGVEITWEKRSLQEFADQPLDQLAECYDLLVIDHPWVGFAARAGLLLPLDEHLPAAYLEDQLAQSVGPSARSYSFDGHQWALAIDTATPVASWRPDLIAGSELPRTWADLLILARAGRVVMPDIAVDTLMNFYMVCSTLGEDAAQSEERIASARVGVQALRMLRELALALDPRWRGGLHLSRDCPRAGWICLDSGKRRAKVAAPEGRFPALAPRAPASCSRTRLRPGGTARSAPRFRLCWPGNSAGHVTDFVSLAPVPGWRISWFLCMRFE